MDCFSGRDAVFISEFIRRKHKGCIMLFQKSEFLFQFSRIPDVVCIQKSDISATCCIDSRIACHRGTLVDFFLDKTNFVRICSNTAFHYIHAVILRAVIHQNQLPVRIGLALYHFNCSRNIFFCIVYRHNDTDHLFSTPFSPVHFCSFGLTHRILSG